jgi:hypothetical protein
LPSSGRQSRRDHGRDGICKQQDREPLMLSSLVAKRLIFAVFGTDQPPATSTMASAKACGAS